MRRVRPKAKTWAELPAPKGANGMPGVILPRKTLDLLDRNVIHFVQRRDGLVLPVAAMTIALAARINFLAREGDETVSLGAGVSAAKAAR